MHPQPFAIRPDQGELSRRAADRYAVVTAVKAQRALNGRSSLPRRATELAGKPPTVHAGLRKLPLARFVSNVLPPATQRWRLSLRTFVARSSSLSRTAAPPDG